MSVVRMGQAFSLSRGFGCLLLSLGIVGILVGCTFWVRLPGGPVVRVTLPDSQVQSFLAKMDRLTIRLLEEARRTGDIVIVRTAVEIREIYFRWLRSMGRSSPHHPVEIAPLEAKLRQYELQLQDRRRDPDRGWLYREVEAYFRLLRWELHRFLQRILQVADP